MTDDETFRLHDGYDIAQASDGHSRYGAYLAQNTRRFRDLESKPVTDAVDFAAAALVVARAPVMSPPYVSTHPRVVFAAPRWDIDRRCCLLIELATSVPSGIADTLPPGLAGWACDPYDGRYLAPDNNGAVAAYSRLAIRLPLPVDLLPTPAYTDIGVPEVEVAKRAVRTVCTYANSVLAHLIVHLDSPHGGGAFRRAWASTNQPSPVAGETDAG